MDIRQLNDLFTDLLASNRGPGYGVEVTGTTADASVVEVKITFLAGKTYCCSEPFCHVRRDAARVLRFAAGRGIPLPEGIEIRWHFVVEAGTLLTCNKASGLPEREVERREFDAVSRSSGAER